MAGSQGRRRPKYGLHKRSGQARVIIRGEHHYLGEYGSEKSWNKYKRLVAEFEADVYGFALPKSGTPLTVEDVVAAYWLHAESYYRLNGAPTQQLACIRAALRPLRKLYATVPVVEFGPKSLKALQATLANDGGLARTTINKRISIIKQMFRWAVSEELIPAGVSHGLSTVAALAMNRSSARETEKVGPVELSIVEATLPHLSPVVADMVRVHLLCGMRPGEVCAMRPCDIDRSTPEWAYRPKHHKTAHLGKSRSVPIGPRAQAILTQYLDRDAEAWCFSPAESERRRRELLSLKRTTPLSCGNRRGTNRKSHPKRSPRKRFTSESYCRAVAYACETAFGMPRELRKPAAAFVECVERLKRQGKSKSKWKIPDALMQAELERREKATAWRAEHCWSPNQLRHARLTFVRMKYGLEAAQNVAGHSKADVTQIYAERDWSLATKVAREIG